MIYYYSAWEECDGDLEVYLFVKTSIEDPKTSPFLADWMEQRAKEENCVMITRADRMMEEEIVLWERVTA